MPEQKKYSSPKHAIIERNNEKKNPPHWQVKLLTRQPEMTQKGRLILNFN